MTTGQAPATTEHERAVLEEVLQAIRTQGTVRRVADLGWASKVSLELTDGQKLVAHSPNEQIQGIGDGSIVYVDLRDAKVFAPKGARPSDELAQG